MKDWKTVAKNQSEQIFSLETKMDELKQKIEKVDITPFMPTIAPTITPINPFFLKPSTSSGWPSDKPNFQSGPFGPPIESAPQNLIFTPLVGGTYTIAFQPTLSRDVMVRNGGNEYITTRLNCITCMREYQDKSLEELRYEDYKRCLKF